MAVPIGHRFPDTTLRLERLRVEEFLTATGVDPTPDYELADGSPLPLGFLMYVTTFGADPVHEALEVDYLRAVYGGARYEMHHPLRVGDDVTIQTTYTNRFEKAGGALTFFEITCDYLRGDGELAVREISTTIERAAS